ncbi:hypothetical protein JRQ81_008671 [Phrynocephalus forsythii]|uniref:Fucosyltransferase n=1 Tax=Phrynocephalus forsythii TaxID=171643 RepID=A0A9Q0XBF3_9SAUR|nr:hypothetical protein JRQ81_008671 [Phrynocephalus forsythii]
MPTAAAPGGCPWRGPSPPWGGHPNGRRILRARARTGSFPLMPPEELPWKDPPGGPSWSCSGAGPLAPSAPRRRRRCSRLGCRLTTNHSRYEAADAVLMYHRDVCCQPQLLPPGPRPRSQLWVWFNMDPPSRSGHLASLDHLFNLTMSFRRDSDIFAPFGWLRVLRRPQNFTIPPKSKLAATVSSHWPAGSRPAKYLEQLRRHLPVDTYGHPERVLPARQLLATLSRYRFYLAFESSAHQDYLTRQLWRNALLAGAVPVVLGPPRENYERHLPPESFIHVDDFPAAHQLAQFLQEVARDPARYRRYFRWRTWLEPQVEKSWAARLCKACRVLREKGETFQPAPDLSRWFT